MVTPRYTTVLSPVKRMKQNNIISLFFYKLFYGTIMGFMYGVR
jgi:hypothetical protein